MTYWMDNEQENRRSLQNLVDPLAPVPVESGPRFTEGALSAPFQGAWHGYSALSTVAGDLTIPYLREVADPIDDVLGTNASAWLEGQREKAHDITRRYRVDPNTTGEVGRILHGAASVITQAAVGSIATGGTAGAAIAAGAGTGYEEYNQLVESGVDPETAKRVAGITAVDTAVGVALPMTIGGGVWGAMAWGAGSNAALGAAGRYDSGKVLANAGYTDMAEQYKALDGVALATDVLMGAGFPVAGHFINKARARLSPGETLADRLTPEQVDAVDVAARQYHDDVETSPGLHKSPESMNAHHEALRVMEDEVLVNGKDPSEVNLDPIVQRMDLEPDARPLEGMDEARAIVESEAPEAARAEAAARVKEAEAAPAEQALALRESGLDMFQILDADGNPVGAIVTTRTSTSTPDGEVVPVLRVDNSGIDAPEAMGKGLGMKAYIELANRILKEGGQLWSDREVSADAVRLYEGLRRRGYTVEVNEKRPPVKTEDGKLVSQGSYVFKVTKGPEAVPLKAETAVPVVDPTDTVAVAKAGNISSMDDAATTQAIDAMPDLTVPHPDTGAPVKASDLMAELDREIETAKQDGDLAQVAVACFKTFGD